MNNECFTPPILEQSETYNPVTFLTKEVLGVNDLTHPPKNGAGRNLIVKYPVTGHVYMYDSAGIPTLINDSEVGGIRVDDALSTTSIYPVENRVVTAAINARAAEDEALYNDIQNEKDTRAAADKAISERIAGVTSSSQAAVDNEARIRREMDENLQQQITQEINDRATADGEYRQILEKEIDDRQYADQMLTDNLADIGADTMQLERMVEKKQDAPAQAGQAGQVLGLRTKLTRDGEATEPVWLNITGGGADINVVQETGDSTEDVMSQNAVTSAIDDVASDVQAIDTAIDKTVISNIELDGTASTDVVKFNKGFVNIKSGDTESMEVPMPVASTTQAGIMNAATFQAVQNNTNKVDALLHASVSIADLAEDPSQEDLTAAWEEAAGLTELINTARINDTTNHKVWTYYANTGTWESINADVTVTVSQATNDSLGIVKGSEVDGQNFVESDGTLSVNGWDNAMSRITNLENNPYVLPLVQTTGSSETSVMSQNAVTGVLDGKQNSLSEAQLNAANSGITADKVSTYDGYAEAIEGKQEQLSDDQLAAANSGITADLVSTYNGYAGTIAGKQASLSETQLKAVNSGITSTKVSTYDGYASQISAKANSADLATVATTGSYNNLVDLPTIPAAANNGTLTITQNGTSLATFSADQAGNATAAITTPVITITTTDPGEGTPLAANNFIAVVEA